MDQRIQIYFDHGLTQAEIAVCLSVIDNVQISIRQLRRRLANLYLYRCGHYSEPEQVFSFIASQLEGPGRLHGYGMMFERCRLHGLRLTREMVREVQLSLDPIGVQERSGRRLRRRHYRVPGPNYLWHMDSYDKFKPYGIAINGCIDGFSRHIIWMQAYFTKNNPQVIAGYYFHAIAEIGGCPQMIRSDFGTENVHVNRLQEFLREDSTDTIHGPSVLQGTSLANQRIESWWGIYRRQNADYWIDAFKELQATGEFTSDAVDKGLVQFCFISIIQDELETVVKMWNNHCIRPGNGRDSYHGRPFLMYNLAELYQARDYLKPVDPEKLDVIIEENIYQWKSDIPCDRDLYELCVLVMDENNLQLAETASEAFRLYRNLRPLIREYLFGI